MSVSISTAPASSPSATGAPTPRRAFVTGATGLLGSAIVRELLDLDSGGAGASEEVFALVRDRERAERLLPVDERLRLIVGDVTDVESFRAQLRGVDAVFHTAAYFREYYEPGNDPGLLQRTNVDAVRSLLEAAAAAEVPVVVHTSSSGTLGSTGDGSPADEDTPPPRFGPGGNLYFQSKVHSEDVVREFCEHHELRVPIVLPGWMWGPGDSGPTGAGRLFLAVAGGQVPAVPRAGNHIVDARDVARACLRAATDGVSQRRYIVAGEWHSLRELTGEIARLSGVRAPREVPARLALLVAGLLELQAALLRRVPIATRTGVRTLTGERARISSTRARDELGISFRPLTETLADEAAWYREHDVLA
jgi:nucleoside-diphosphate-sugar epimerase